VAEVQHQARRTLAVAAAFILASPLAALAPHDTGLWLPLHLFLVGGVLSAISGTTQLLAVTWSTAPAPSRLLAAEQRAGIAGGTVAIAVGREIGSSAVIAIGGSALAAALALLGAILWTVRHGAGTPRFRPAIDAYLIAIAFGLVGVALGATIAIDGGDWWERLRGAHLIVNLFGLVGLTIVGTLPYFVATQARTKMSPRVTPLRQRALLLALTIATATAATGQLIASPGMTAAGLSAWALTMAGVVALLPSIHRRQLSWAGPRLVALFAGLTWWIIAAGVLALDPETGLEGERQALLALSVGGVAQIVIASLAYLTPVLRGGGHQRLTAGFSVTRSWVWVVAANTAAAALLLDRSVLAALALTAWGIDVAVRAALLLSARRTSP
jgi:nitrite reductase (NO-forming)